MNIKKIRNAILLSSVFLLAACSNSSQTSSVESLSEFTSNDLSQEDSASNDLQTEFPITIEHALGQIVIEEQPQRVASVGWGNQDVALALGIAPVISSEVTFGPKTENGLLPWTEEKHKELGVSDIKTFSDTDGIDFEAISDSKPDVILAAYSGITQEDYDTLSEIAPVVAYKENAWQTEWRDELLDNAEGLGKVDEAQKLLKETEDLIDEKVKEYPNLEGKSAAFIWVDASDMSSFSLYTSIDPRASYLTDLGLEFPEDDLSSLITDESAFFTTVSAENVEALKNIDILVTYGDDTTLKAMQEDELLSTIPAVKRGSVVVLDMNDEIGAATTPTVLSIPATIDGYLDLLSKAAEKVD